MALLGITASQFEAQIKIMIEHHRSESVRLQHEALWWTGKAEAYSRVLDGKVWSRWDYDVLSTAAQNCRNNATLCRVQAEAHLEKVAHFERIQAKVLAAGRLDPEGF